MKLVDDFLAKVGADKVLHFFGGGFICAIFAFVALLQDGVYTNESLFGSVFIGTILVIVLSLIKEVIDNDFEWKDILAALIGCLFIFASVGVGLIFNFLSR